MPPQNMCFLLVNPSSLDRVLPHPAITFDVSKSHSQNVVYHILRIFINIYKSGANVMFSPRTIIWVFPKKRDIPKWMVKIMENPIKMDDLGVPLFSETSMYVCRTLYSYFPLYVKKLICFAQTWFHRF